MSALERARPSDPRVPVSPQLALRVAVLGGVAMAMFAIIFFRLWYLQVLTGEQYVQQANANRVRDLPIAAPRGQILDREGQPIVASSTVTNAVQIVPSALPPAGAPRLALYRRLGRSAGDEPAAHRGARGEGAHRPALRAGDDQDRRRPGRADRARRAPERIPRGRPAAGLDPRLPVWRDGRAGARLRRPGLRTGAQAARLPRRQAGNRGRPGRARVLLRPLPARAAGRAARGGQRRGLSGSEQARLRPSRRPATASR